MLEEINSDPYIGYETIEDALADYKCTTQAEVLSRLLARENVFISGPAGSGKSFVLNRFSALIDAQFHGKFNIALTASTGIAATIIGGRTIHSWAGLGIDTTPFDPQNVDKAIKAKVKEMRETDVLIIDEISMLPAYLFEKLDLVLKWARRNSRPFGGVQIVLTGDFLQLPPVSKAGDNVDTSFAITTDAWKQANIQYCYMDKSHRATDRRLKYVLGKIAAGKARADENTTKLIKSRRGSLEELADKNKVYTTLFTINRNVDSFNENELEKNANPLVVARIVRRNGSKVDQDKIIKSNSVPEVVKYKVGATVMLTANIRADNGEFLPNGALGIITGTRSENGFTAPMVRFNSGIYQLIAPKAYMLSKKVAYTDKTTGEVEVIEEPIAQVDQIPLKLGYAISVHKSQGQSFQGVVADLSKIFTPGLGYVALSRVSSLDDLIITGWTDKALDLDPHSKKVSNFVKRQALNGRAEFEANLANYTALLESDLSRLVMWQDGDSNKLNKGGGWQQPAA